VRTLTLALVAAGCATAPAAPHPDELAFAKAYLDRGTVAVHDDGKDGASPASSLPKMPGPAEEIRGLLEVDPEPLRAVAADEDALTELLAKPVSRAELEALAWLRSPAVRAARARLEAARTESLFIVPCVYCLVKAVKWRLGWHDPHFEKESNHA